MGGVLCSWWALTPRVPSGYAQVSLVGGGPLLNEGGVIDCLPFSPVTVGPPPMLLYCSGLVVLGMVVWSVTHAVTAVPFFIVVIFFPSIIVINFRIISLL